jgi:hypothetical protein
MNHNKNWYCFLHKKCFIGNLVIKNKEKPISIWVKWCWLSRGNTVVIDAHSHMSRHKNNHIDWVN